MEQKFKLIETDVLVIGGGLAGAWAALRAKELMDQVEALREEIYSPLHRVDGIMPDEIFEEINKLHIHAKYSIFKDKKRIERVLQRVHQIERNLLPKLKAPDVHELVKSMEAVNFVTAVKLAYSSALIREESRTYHYREDYPYRDDINWLKWIVIKKDDKGEMKVSKGRIPLEEYPVKPVKRERHPVLIQINIAED